QGHRCRLDGRGQVARLGSRRALAGRGDPPPGHRHRPGRHAGGSRRRPDPQGGRRRPFPGDRIGRGGHAQRPRPAGGPRLGGGGAGPLRPPFHAGRGTGPSPRLTAGSLSAVQPFRFGAMVGRAGSRQEWLDQIRMAEDLGYSTLFISDHFSDKLAPLPALAMAAEHTSLNIGTLVLANDFRHPAVVAPEAATVALLSGGRLELGMGTGWDAADYATSGIRKDPPRVQVDRFEEAVVVLKETWADGPVDF